VQFKASIVENDEMEISGLRKVLNIGHTFAHAIEVEQKHKIKHGQAVIVGLACALHLSNKMNLLNDNELQKYLSLIIKFVDKIKIAGYDPHKLYEIMKRDKKNKADTINFVLLKKAGNILVDVEAEQQDVFYALNKRLSISAMRISIVCCTAYQRAICSISCSFKSVKRNAVSFAKMRSSLKFINC